MPSLFILPIRERLIKIPAPPYARSRPHCATYERASELPDASERKANAPASSTR